MTITTFVGKALKAQRKRKRITLTEIAHKTGINQGTLSRYETGVIDIPIDPLARVCHVLEIRPSELMHEAEELEFAYAKMVMADPRMKEMLYEIRRMK